jgi:hypothetical protein
MTREEAKELFRNDKDAYGKPKHIMKNIDKIYDDFEAQQQVKNLNIPVVICSCENNSSCIKEEDGNGEWRDYCLKCKCFRN